ncbi:MAG: hypothetical protein K2P81_17080 [Bacteriovoracaceae bacterium]|nr:hypothetical protein [Bacteriovoracaceae bacterium]
MKTSITSLKSSSLLLALLLAPTLAHAKLIGKVHAIKGNAFIIQNQKTLALAKDMDIEEGAQVMVSDDSQVTLGDFYDRRFHVSSGSHIVLNDMNVILQKGSLWSQSLTTNTKMTLSTANLLISSYKGEYIVTYSTAEKKSQLTVVTGEVDVASPREPAFRYAVSAGQFTMAIPDVNDGYPRTPTKVGYESLMAAVHLFPGIKSQDAGVAQAQAKPQASEADRSIASVNEKKGEIIFMTTIIEAKREPASAAGEAQKYFVKKFTKKKLVSTPAKVRVIGFQEVKSASSRKPASSQKVQTQAPEIRVNDSEFLKSYEQLRSQQPKNPQEVQRLIDDLNSY